MKRFLHSSLFFVFSLVAQTEGTGAGLPEGYERFEDTQSPDQRWVICGPEQKSFEYDGKNFVLDTSSGEVFATLLGGVGRPNMNHMDIEARWTSDSKNLLWIVHGKWGPGSVVYFQIHEDGTPTQLDLRKEAVSEILKRLREKFPEEYETVKKEYPSKEGYYPHGFTVDIRFAAKNPELPFDFYVGTTSSPKGIPTVPENSTKFWIDGFIIEGFITGRLETGRTISWRDFETNRQRGEGYEINGGIQENEGNLRHSLAQLEEKVAARLTGRDKEKFLKESRDWLDQLETKRLALMLSFSDHFSLLLESKLIEERIGTLKKLAQ